MSSNYQLVRTRNGAHSVRSLAEGETFHPVAGPVAEAEALYVRQLHLAERIRSCTDEFVLWDVGLGSAANALVALRSTAEVPGRVRLISFDRTLAALAFALEHSASLEYLNGFETAVRTLLEQREVRFRNGRQDVFWSVELGDFPTCIANAAVSLAAPHAIFFDAFSPARNPEMWMLSTLAALHQRLHPARACSLATFSRSTLARTSLLLAGFFVGAGESLSGKEETTVAANTPDLIPSPLGAVWLRRALRSHSAEPLHGPKYVQQPLAPDTRERLELHAQFTVENAKSPGGQLWKNSGQLSG